MQYPASLSYAYNLTLSFAPNPVDPLAALIETTLARTASALAGSVQPTYAMLFGYYLILYNVSQLVKSQNNFIDLKNQQQDWNVYLYLDIKSFYEL